MSQVAGRRTTPPVEQVFAAFAEHLRSRPPPGISRAYLEGFLARNEEALRSHLDRVLSPGVVELAERESLCPYCEGDAEELSGPCGVDACWSPKNGDVWVQWTPCCEARREVVSHWGFEAVYGRSLKAVVQELIGCEVLDVTEPGDSAIVCRLAITNPTQLGAPDALGRRTASSPAGWQTEVFDLVARHHRHHEPPTGHKFSLAVRNGLVRVGVAVVGRPTSRVLAAAEPHTLEVTRVTTWGHPELRRNAASKLYAAAAKEARRLGYTKLITYTLAGEESGVSLRAAGWAPVAETRGGSWDRPGRRREDRAPIGRKVRWEVGLERR